MVHKAMTDGIFYTVCPLDTLCNAASSLSSQKKEASVLVEFLARDANSLDDAGSEIKANTSYFLDRKIPHWLNYYCS